jgi:hypothetical protein
VRVFSPRNVLWCSISLDKPSSTWYKFALIDNDYQFHLIRSFQGFCFSRFDMANGLKENTAGCVPMQTASVAAKIMVS